MVDKPPKTKRRVRPAQTVRERTQQPQPASKPKRLRRSASRAAGPLRSVGGWVGKLLKPLSPLLAPFKTRPVRFVGNILAIITGLKFIRNAWRELKGVKWPNRKETTQLTIAVFIFATIFGVIIAVTDYGLDKIFKKVLLK